MWGWDLAHCLCSPASVKLNKAHLLQPPQALCEPKACKVPGLHFQCVLQKLVLLPWTHTRENKRGAKPHKGKKRKEKWSPHLNTQLPFTATFSQGEWPPSLCGLCLRDCGHFSSHTGKHHVYHSVHVGTLFYSAAVCRSLRHNQEARSQILSTISVAFSVAFKLRELCELSFQCTNYFKVIVQLNGLKAKL